MKKTILKQYAHLIATTGVNVQKGQGVVLYAELDQPEFVRILVDECYKAGASEVEVIWDYQPLTKLHVRHQKLKTLSEVKDWELSRLHRRADTLPASIYLRSADPDGLAGMNMEKWSKGRQARLKVTKPIQDEMDNKYQWCIAGVPGDKWAKKVFPELPKGRAVEKLWETILYVSRADGPDPAAAWAVHNESLAARCRHLNALGLRSLEYKAANGTDLTVGLIPEARFHGGADTTLGTGVVYNPNIPSEEVYTSPMKGKAEGVVFSSMPFAYRGVVIEDFSLTFKDGRVVEVKAAKNEDALRQLVAMDEGACMLGECALVPYDSPIRNSGILFYDTLYDENAACHLALGFGFENCVEGYEALGYEKCREMGINDSVVHEDFMIGTEDMSIVGVDAKGKKHRIFKNGSWAF